MGVTLTSFAGYGIGQFAAPYFIRTFGLDYAVVGLIFGLIGGFSAGLGTIAGGIVSDRASRWGTAVVRPDAGDRAGHRRAALFPRLHPARLAHRGGHPAVPRHLRLHLSRPDVRGGAERGRDPPSGDRHRRAVPVPQHHRAGRRSAVHRLGHRPPGAGPVPRRQLRRPLPRWRRAPRRAPALAARCKGALLGGTRQGILVTIAFYVWGSCHYLLASFGLSKEMASVAAARKLQEA